jgi:Flp pilus assembly protein TadG
MLRLVRSESGQITILVLAISLALLAGTCLVGAVAQVMVTQQRLNTKAESIALAGAQELQLNEAQACDFAKAFSAANFGLDAECISQTGSIEILLSEPNPNTFLGEFLPNIYATSRAGIAGDK